MLWNIFRFDIVKPFSSIALICHISGVREHRTEARIGVREIIVSLKFDERGATFSILEFICFAKRK